MSSNHTSTTATDRSAAPWPTAMPAFAPPDAELAGRMRAAVAALPVCVESVGSEQAALAGAAAFERVTTTLVLGGGGHEGRGEDVAYAGETHQALPAAFGSMDLRDARTIGELSDLLDAGAFEAPSAEMDDKAGYHRWAIESSALDLALRQTGTSLDGLLGAPPRPLRTSVSMGLGSPPSVDIVTGWLSQDPHLTFKLDTSSEWTLELITQLADTGAVTLVDFKGLYTGDWIDNTPDATLYMEVARILPSTLIEDANLTPDVLDALDEDALARLAWDFPITGPATVPGLPGSMVQFSDLRPAAINIKPSRFGSFAALLDTMELCGREGIPCYAGGQYELGVGRTQIQELAAIFFPDAPNDCAPVVWHGASPGADMPRGRLVVPEHVGFGWDAPTPATRRDTAP